MEFKYLQDAVVSIWFFDFETKDLVLYSENNKLYTVLVNMYINSNWDLNASYSTAAALKRLFTLHFPSCWLLFEF